MQTANPLELKIQAIIPGSYQTECSLHKLFEKDHYRGEWFRYSDQIKWFLAAIRLNPEENNIYSLYKESSRLRIREKALRLKRKGNPKLKERVDRITGGV